MLQTLTRRKIVECPCGIYAVALCRNGHLETYRADSDAVVGVIVRDEVRHDSRAAEEEDSEFVK